MRPYLQQVAILLSLSMALSLGATLNGNFITNKHSGAIKPSVQGEREYATSENLADLFKHNFAVLKGQNGSPSAELINKFGMGNVLKPVQMNYMFLFEGLSDSADNEQAQSVLFPNAEPFTLVLPDGQSVASEAKLLDLLFGHESQSLATLIEQSYNTDERIPFYYFSASVPRQESLAKLFAEYGMSFVNTNADKISLYDEREERLFGNAFTVQECLKQHFNDMFVYSAQEETFYKLHTHLKLQASENNMEKVQHIFKEVCGTLKMSTVFKKSSKPNHITFHLQSFANIAESLSASEIAFVQDLWRVTINKVISNFGKSFSPSEVFGETLFLAPGQVEIDLLRNEIGNIKSTLNERTRVLSLQNTHTRVLQTPPLPPTNSAKQIQFWICIIFPVIIYFICYQLFTMKVHKDSLLYAKFLASDVRL